MTGPRLPDGFAVQVDRRVKVLGEITRQKRVPTLNRTSSVLS